jgi:hypothetical protein
MDLTARLADVGIAIPEIVLPSPATDLEKWATIACDQSTQDRGYWESAKSIAGAAPTALNLILPKLYLGEPDGAARIRAIHETMDNYLRGGVLAAPRRCALYIERRTPRHARRRGLVVAVDLECYGWSGAEGRLLIRATEDTVPARLPARMAIRAGARRRAKRSGLCSRP